MAHRFHKVIEHPKEFINSEEDRQIRQAVLGTDGVGPHPASKFITGKHSQDTLKKVLTSPSEFLK